MKLNAHWPSILEAARRGDLEPARQGRQLDPAGVLADYFYGRCLAEAEVDLPEAIALLRGAAEAEPANPLIVQTLALALARSPEPADKARAAAIWHREGLSLDLDLLGQISLTLEAQCRPWPESAETDEAARPWPEGLPRPDREPPAAAPGEGSALVETGEPASVPAAEVTGTGDGAETDASAEPSAAQTCLAGIAAAPAPAPPKLGFFARRRLGRVVGRMEAALLEHHTDRVLEMADEALARGAEDAEFHLVAGLAADEAGLPLRARAHLARADLFEPGMLLARAWLGRLYWRSGWHELALALWRSVPVEGPYDYGRHYHLALGHDALGDRPAALAAMAVALDRFYYDTRHFYIKRVLWQWQALWGRGES